MSEKEIIENIHNEKTAFPNPGMAKDLANALSSLSADIYTDYIRFVFELIQNADDSDAKNIIINIQDKHIAISHNGKAFDELDVKGICSIGEGTKKSDNTKTGYKGIGFKSVFGKSKNVGIFSKGYQFQFTDQYKHPNFPDTKMPWQIIPTWAEKNKYPCNLFDTDYEGSMNVTTIIELKSTEIFITDLRELLENGEVLLFLRSVVEINVVGKEQLTISKESNRSEEAYTEINIKKNDRILSEWITYTFKNIKIEEAIKLELQTDDKTPEKLKMAENAKISFAAKVENGKITSLTGTKRLIYTFLPTRITSFQLPFLINSSFLTNASRDALHEDSLWNQWLMETAAKKTIDWLAELADSKKFCFQILHLVPKINNQGSKLSNKYFEAFNSYIKIKRLIPSSSNKLLKVSEVLIDTTGLSDLEFIKPTLIEFINDKNSAELKIDSFVHPDLQKKLELKLWGGVVFNKENIEEFLNSSIFKRSHKIIDNYPLIEFFHQKFINTDASDFKERIKYLSFILAKGKKLKSPQDICFPTKDFATPSGAGVPVIHMDVYEKIAANTELKLWLE